MESYSTENNKLGLVIVGALLAAVVGGIVWVIIAIITEYEIGIVAWAIGDLAGYAVVFFAKEIVDKVHQIIANTDKACKTGNTGTS